MPIDYFLFRVRHQNYFLAYRDSIRSQNRITTRSILHYYIEFSQFKGNPVLLIIIYHILPIYPNWWILQIAISLAIFEDRIIDRRNQLDQPSGSTFRSLLYLRTPPL